MSATEVKEVKEVKLNLLLTPIVTETYPVERFQKLWEKMLSQDYAFDDLTREDPTRFAALFAFPNNLFWEIGDLQGLVCALGLSPRLDVSLHFAVWGGSLKITDLMRAGKSLQAFLFETYGLNRISAEIPNQNLQARRLAKLLWFEEEGNRRKAFLSHGNYSDIMCFGLLRSEFNRFVREGF